MSKHVRLRSRSFRLASAGALLAAFLWSLFAASAHGAAPCGSTGVLAGTTCTYSTVGTDTFTVPAGVQWATMELYGASGGYIGAWDGEYGGAVTATVSVAPGEVLQVNVGGKGGNWTASTVGAVPGGFNGGGDGGTGATGGAGGGGASDVRDGTFSLANRLLVAAGGGGTGTGGDGSGGDGGRGGGLTGEAGDAGIGSIVSAGLGGDGGSQSAGGIGGRSGGALTTAGSGLPGAAGAGGRGGHGQDGGSGGGGGGGGWFGGGGGGGGNGYYTAPGGGGGGGSSFGPADGIWTGVRRGDGLVKITWSGPTSTSSSSSSSSSSSTTSTTRLSSLPALAINDVSVTEGHTGTKVATFTITRSGSTTGASSVQWATVNGTAMSGSDYVAVPATTVSFAAGETTKSAAVTINGDTAAEPDETFSVNLFNVSGAAIADGTGIGTIVNDDTGLAVNDVSVTEGHSGTTLATFTITRSGVTTGASSVQWATANGTAISGSDYVAVPATTVSFAAGETTKSAAVTINGDAATEADETFTVNLSAATGASIVDGTGLGTVVNDDTGLAVNDVSVTEGDYGTRVAMFTITRSGVTTGNSSVQWATANRTATAGSDYVAVPATTVSFAAGETVKSASVTVNGDTSVEPNEAFRVVLSAPSGATIVDGTGVGSIVNDDTAIAVGDLSIVEGNAGTKLATFTMTRSGLTSGTSSVQWATANGTAIAGSDYTAVPATTVTFAAGETTKPASVTVIGDVAVEPDETFTVNLSSPSGARITDYQAVGTITDDDTAPTTPAYLAVSDVAVTEGNSGPVQAVFTVTRSGGTNGSSTVEWYTEPGSATVGSDYVHAARTTLGFRAGETTKTVSVTVNGDLSDEPEEYFVVRLSNPTGATLADSRGDGTILDDDGPTYLSVADVSVTEGSSGTTQATFRITRSGVTTGTSSVEWFTQPATATAGSDYVHVPRTRVHFAAGETAKSIPVTVNGDTTDEADEQFGVRLENAVGASIADSAADGLVLDDDGPTYLSVNDLSLTEGSAGTTQATFTLTRSGVTAGQTSVDWYTQAGDASASSDYVHVARTRVDFAAGETTKALAVTVSADAADEANEYFTVRLDRVAGGTISDGVGRATIVDDDGPVTAGPSTFLSVDDIGLTEGNSGTELATFTVTRSGDTTGASSVQWYTATGSARDLTDFVKVPSTTVSFAAGETTKAVSVTVNGDVTAEDDEWFYVRLGSPVGAAVSDDEGRATIVNDDGVAYLSVNDLSLTEGSSGTKLATFTITRSGATAGASSVQWYTSNGSADSLGDYVKVTATTMSFAAGETTKSASVTVDGDTMSELDEWFYVRLQSAVGATISDDSGKATIVNDDGVAYVSVSDVSVAEGDSGTRLATFTITRSGATAGASSVQWYTANGSADSLGDYVKVTATTMSFAAGETTKSASVTVNGDTTAEGDETFYVRLQSAVGAQISDDEGRATIVNDD